MQTFDLVLFYDVRDGTDPPCRHCAKSVDGYTCAAAVVTPTGVVCYGCVSDAVRRLREKVVAH